MSKAVSDSTLGDYQTQLEDKERWIKKEFNPFFDGEISVFESPAQHYRMRAEFRVWHEGDDLFHIMFDQQTKEKYRVDTFLPASETINAVMTKLMEKLRPNPILRQRLFQIDYLSGLSNEVLVSLLYHRKLDDEWEKAISQLKDELSDEFNINFVGRSRKQKVIKDQDFIIEKLPISGHEYIFKHVENSFTQPNAQVNCKMIEWCLDKTANIEGDLLELYCGAGNFSIPLAQNFNNVVGTEISRTSVNAALFNIEQNKTNNVKIVRMSSEEFSDALINKKPSRRLQECDIENLSINTVLVDPPRAGLDQDTIELISQFENIIYISCNPETLKENLASLTRSHDVTDFAIFDQFPYTHHIESGVILNKR